jgi:seryl-tRNA synthetase
VSDAEAVGVEDASSAFPDRLFKAGVLVPMGVDGVYGRGAVFEHILEGLDALATRVGADDGAERVRFPPVMVRRHFERSGYMKGFPQLAGTIHCFCGDQRAHRDLLRRLEAGEDWTAGQTASDVVLTPAACYEVYPMLAARGGLPEQGALVDVMSWCFRHEPSSELTRMQLFRMREYVRVGTPAQVEAFRAGWMRRAEALIESLGLPYTIDVANDPFFGRPGKLQADIQRSQQLKFELLVPVNEGADPTACLSFNYHQDHFGGLWGVMTPDGLIAHSGCVAFGLERLTLAMLRLHGLDPADWPARVRSALWP